MLLSMGAFKFALALGKEIGRSKCWKRAGVYAFVPVCIGIISIQARGILPRPEEQSRTCGCQSGSIEDQPQWPGL